MRVYDTARGPHSFNPSDKLMRFRPIYDRGAVVATAYAGEDGLIALAETVLREVDVGSGSVLPAVRLRGLSIAELVYPDDLTLLQLNGLGMRKLGLGRGEVIDTGPSAYPFTARVAQALYDAHRDAQGIVWTSHQADHGDAAMLWDKRMDSSRLEVEEGPYRLDGGQGLRLVRVACERLGVLLEY